MDHVHDVLSNGGLGCRRLGTGRARSFGSAAEEYDASRPGYPIAAIDWSLGSDVDRVLDLAAGTGTLTRQLVARGLDVIAVEPDAAMRAVLRRRCPSVDVREGLAEQVPLPDQAVDAVVVGQAWHWFDEARAAPEIRRVLRPGGRLGVLWNLRRHTADWHDAFTRLLTADDTIHMPARQLSLGVEGERAHTMHVEWDDPVDVQGVVTLASSHSTLRVLPREARTRRLAQVEELAMRAAEDGPLRLAYTTRCQRVDLPTR